MIIAGCCVRGENSSFHKVALPSLNLFLDPGDQILTQVGDGKGISAVYNEFISKARNSIDCEALVLLHDDVQIIDKNFRGKVLSAVKEDNVGVIGVVGGSGLRSLEWWLARRLAGRVFETRGCFELGSTRADVDVVDGLLLILSPSLFNSIDFDETSFPHFHGYDVDFCLQARNAKYRVIVRPIDLLHRTKTGYGDKNAFLDASEMLKKKWPNYVKGGNPKEELGLFIYKTRKKIFNNLLRWKIFFQGIKGVDRKPYIPDKIAFGIFEKTALREKKPKGQLNIDEVASTAFECVACGNLLPQNQFATTIFSSKYYCCEHCQARRTFPSYQGDLSEEGSFLDIYDKFHLKKRKNKFEEARKRIEWIQLYMPEGSLLEIECATGEFLKVALDEGYDVFGVDTRALAAEFGRKLGVPVVSGNFLDWTMKFPGISPDGVVMWHVLEYINDPNMFLKDVRKQVKPGTFLFIEVPNFEENMSSNLGIDLDGSRSEPFYKFTKNGLDVLLSGAKFNVIHNIQISKRVYTSGKNWRNERHKALMRRQKWPCLEFIRVVARAS